MVLMLMLGRRNEGLRVEMPAMAGSTGDLLGCLGVVVLALHLRGVVLVDLHGHFEHEARGLFFGLGVVGKIQRRTSIGHLAGGIHCVAGVALHTELAFPLMHDVVYLVAGEGLGQHLKVLRRGSRRMRVCGAGGRLFPARRRRMLVLLRYGVRSQQGKAEYGGGHGGAGQHDWSQCGEVLAREVFSCQTEFYGIRTRSPVRLLGPETHE